MFKFIKKLFRKTQNQTVVAIQEATPEPETKQKPSLQALPILYRNGLVEKMKQDHQSLLHIYTQLITAAEQKNAVETKQQIKTFHNQLSEHLSEEYKDLYVFLEYFSMHYQPDLKDSIRDFKSEMQDISRTVMGIIHRHEYETLETDESFSSVLSDFGMLGDALVDRINREESDLYEIYDSVGKNYIIPEN